MFAIWSSIEQGAQLCKEVDASLLLHLAETTCVSDTDHHCKTSNSRRRRENTIQTSEQAHCRRQLLAVLVTVQLS